MRSTRSYNRLNFVSNRKGAMDRGGRRGGRGRGRERGGSSSSSEQPPPLAPPPQRSRRRRGGSAPPPPQQGHQPPGSGHQRQRQQQQGAGPRKRRLAPDTAGEAYPSRAFLLAPLARWVSAYVDWLHFALLAYDAGPCRLLTMRSIQNLHAADATYTGAAARSHALLLGGRAAAPAPYAARAHTLHLGLCSAATSTATATAATISILRRIDAECSRCAIVPSV